MTPTKRRARSQLKVVDFFCGAGGMSLGLSLANLKIVAGIDFDDDCQATYEANLSGAKFINSDISKLRPSSLSTTLAIEPGDDSMVFAGCSPCQYWSKIQTDRTKSAQSAFLLKEFQKHVRYFRPGFLMVENVPGLLNRKNESVLPRFLNFLSKSGYAYDHAVINSNHYGVPQNRIRYLLIASRLQAEIQLPPPEEDPSLVVGKFIGAERGFPKIPAGHRDDSDFMHSASALSDFNLRRIKKIRKPGGDRMAWKDDEELQINAYRGEGGDKRFRDVYGRMAWDRPAPTITTRFNSLSNGRFGHPTEHRAISLREGATLQTFPRTFIFKGSSQNSLARQIGNAVPPELARRVGEHLYAIFTSG